MLSVIASLAALTTVGACTVTSIYLAEVPPNPTPHHHVIAGVLAWLSLAEAAIFALCLFIRPRRPRDEPTPEQKADNEARCESWWET